MLLLSSILMLLASIGWLICILSKQSSKKEIEMVEVVRLVSITLSAAALIITVWGYQIGLTTSLFHTSVKSLTSLTLLTTHALGYLND